MSELQGLKKAELNSICRKVGIHTLAKDTKKVLVDKLSAYIENNPEDGLIAVQNSLDQETEDEDENTLAEEAGDDTEEEEEEGGDDDEGVGAGGDKDGEDKDYEEGGAPIKLKEWIVDPVLEKYELAVDKVLELKDSLQDHFNLYNDELRESLSTAVFLNAVELVLEAVFYFYTFVPFVALSDNDSIHQVFKDNIPYLSTSDLPLPDLTALLDEQAIYVFVYWVIFAIVVPLVISYYVNFTRRIIVIDEDEDSGIITRAYATDPFIFALSKVVIYYFIAKNEGTLTTFDSFGGLFVALKTHFLVKLGIYRNFTGILGNFPLVIGLANVLTALYSQFEEY